MSWTSASILIYIQKSLGSDYRAVELHANAYAQALKRAVGKMSGKVGVLKKGSFSVIEGQQKYAFTTDVTDEATGFTGNGVIVAFTGQSLDNAPVKVGSVVIDATANSPELLDLHDGTLADTAGTSVGTIDYTTGALTLTYVAGSAPTDLASITADYTQINNLYGRGILDVALAPLVSPSDVFSEAEYFRIRQPPYIEAGELVADRLYYKELSIITGSEFDWYWDQSSETMMLTPSPVRSCFASYTYKDDFSDISEVPDGRQGWVVDYTFALCKQIVGRVRNKFSGQVPGNELSVETDGSDMLQEGKEEQEKLDESLKKIPAWNPPIKA